MPAGGARSSSFMLGAATVMIGPQASLWDLTPDTHSIGLVKNFSISAEPSMTELTQGVKNTLVYSVMTGNSVRAQCEVYEYTSKNLAYGLGLDGSTLVPRPNRYTTNAALNGTAAPGVTTTTFITDTNVSASFPAGTWIAIQDAADEDKVHYAKLSAATTNTGTAPTITHTLTFSGYGVKTGVSFAAGATIRALNLVKVGSTDPLPFFSCKVVGILPENNEPMAVLLPKVRITRGFTLAFSTENYGNLPFQMQPYDLVSTDSFYNEFKNVGQAMLLASS